MNGKLPAFTLRTLINNYGYYLKAKLGMDENDIEKEYQDFCSKQPDSSVRDYMWSLFNRSILRGGGMETYRSMGMFVARFEGKNGNRYHKIALEAQFKGLMEVSLRENIKSGISIIGNENCELAMKHNGTHDFNDFSDGLPLASHECSLLNCTCDIGIVPLRDINGRLIWLTKD